MLDILRTQKFLFVTTLIFTTVIILLVSVRCLHQNRGLLNIIGDKNHEGFGKHVVARSLFVERISQVEEVCNEFSSQTRTSVWEDLDVLDHILVDTKHQVLYCYVPKVACTNFKRLFMKMTGKSNASDILSIPAHEAHDRQFHSTLRNFTAVDAEYFLKKYTKFMFVRHPFERLLSAYKNKLEQNYIGSKYFKDRIGKYIMQNYRTKKNQSGQANGEDITFEEFTNFLLNSEQKGFNEHWKPMHRLCEPCLVKYDFVGKYETLSSDANFILRKIGATNLSFPQALGSSTTAKQLKKYFANLPSSKISNLYNIYKLDFKMFSYSLLDLLGYEIN